MFGQVFLFMYFILIITYTYTYTFTITISICILVIILFFFSSVKESLSSVFFIGVFPPQQKRFKKNQAFYIIFKKTSYTLLMEKGKILQVMEKGKILQVRKVSNRAKLCPSPSPLPKSFEVFYYTSLGLPKILI